VIPSTLNARMRTFRILTHSKSTLNARMRTFCMPTHPNFVTKIRVTIFGRRLYRTQQILQQNKRAIVVAQLHQLADVCRSMASMMAKTNDPRAAEFANMTRDQLSSECGLFDPPCDDIPVFPLEEQLLLSLVSHIDALTVVITHSPKTLTSVEITLFHELVARCTVYACVIKYHLLILMIVYNATSDSNVPIVRTKGSITGSCTDDKERFAKYVALLDIWFDRFSVNRINEEVGKLLSCTAP